MKLRLALTFCLITFSTSLKAESALDPTAPLELGDVLREAKESFNTFLEFQDLVNAATNEKPVPSGKLEGLVAGWEKVAADLRRVPVEKITVGDIESSATTCGRRNFLIAGHNKSLIENDEKIRDAQTEIEMTQEGISEVKKTRDVLVYIQKNLPKLGDAATVQWFAIYTSVPKALGKIEYLLNFRLKRDKSNIAFISDVNAKLRSANNVLISFQKGANPAGNYKDTCHPCSSNCSTLQCTCAKINHTLVNTSLEFFKNSQLNFTSCFPIQNIDGQLKCKNP